MSQGQLKPESVQESEPQLTSSPTQSKLKQMRRIHEKIEPPTDKTELIKYLSERISQAQVNIKVSQDALVDTQQLLDSQVKQRQKISVQIQQRNEQLQKLYQVDQRGLPQKIRQKLTQILTTTVSQKVEAQQKLSDQKSKNYEYKRMYDELKWQEKNITFHLDEQKRKEQILNKQIQTLEEENKQHQNQLNQKEINFNQLKQKKQLLQNRYLQMKIALDRMADIKAVLNRFFGNEDLFDEKMDLKEQRIQRIEIPSRESQPRQTNRESKTQTRLKPITLTKNNDDEDFWRGDYKGKL